MCSKKEDSFAMMLDVSQSEPPLSAASIAPGLLLLFCFPFRFTKFFKKKLTGEVLERTAAFVAPRLLGNYGLLSKSYFFN